MFDDEYEFDENDEDLDTADGRSVGTDQVDLKLLKSIKTNDNDSTEKKTNDSESAAEDEKLKFLKLIQKYFLMSIEQIINFFNSYSQDYRQVSKTLTKEKIILKTTEFNNSSQQQNSSSCTNTNQILNSTTVEMDEVDAEYDLQGKPLIYRLFNTIYYLILSQSELVCYFLMILTHLLSASILSLPLPLSVFLWALLSLPRPNKIYWITCITYTEVSRSWSS
jgi:hypothetical protein